MRMTSEATISRPLSFQYDTGSWVFRLLVFVDICFQLIPVEKPFICVVYERRGLRYGGERNT